MKPIMLKGHERALTCVIYNSDGDLIFTAAKDDKPNVWYADNGERLGTFHGHNGAVWDLAVTRDSRVLASGSADTAVMLWDVHTGRRMMTLEHDGPVRSVKFDLGDKRLLTAQDPFMAYKASIRVFALERNPDGTLNEGLMSTRPILMIDDLPKMSMAIWMPLNKAIMGMGNDGVLRLYDPKTGAHQKEKRLHKKKISDICFSHDQTLFLTASADNWARLWDVRTLDELKAYETDRPVNGCAISPIKEHVLIGGGQDAMSVTTTSSKAGKFETRFFHMITTEEFGRIAGHFGPINCLAMSPDGKSYASGGEDGYTRVHHLEEDYLKMEGRAESLAWLDAGAAAASAAADAGEEE
eukprot:g1346.t1